MPIPEQKFFPFFIQLNLQLLLNFLCTFRTSPLRLKTTVLGTNKKAPNKMYFYQNCLIEDDCGNYKRNLVLIS